VERVARYAVPAGRSFRGYSHEASRRVVPVEVQVGVGAVVVVAATIVGALVPTAFGGTWRVVPVASAVLVFAMLPTDARAVPSTAALAYLLVIGFLVNRFGELSWHGESDVDRLVLIFGAAGTGLLARALRRRGRGNRLYIPIGKDVRGG
jgi:hypothetical protein